MPPKNAPLQRGLLQSYQRLHREAAEEVKAILQSAEATAQRIRETAEKNAVAAVKRREQQADAKIKAAEASMVADRYRSSPLSHTHTSHEPGQRVLSSSWTNKWQHLIN